MSDKRYSYTKALDYEITDSCRSPESCPILTIAFEEDDAKFICNALNAHTEASSDSELVQIANTEAYVAKIRGIRFRTETKEEFEEIQAAISGVRVSRECVEESLQALEEVKLSVYEKGRFCRTKKQDAAIKELQAALGSEI